MHFAVSTAIAYSQRAIGLAVLLQTLELWQLRALCADSGIWRWPVLRREQACLPAPLRWLFALLSPYPRFVGLLVLRFSGALALLMAADVPGLALGLWLSQVAICVRFRGTFNGGSDYMSVLILFALGIAGLTRSSLLWQNACLAYIAVQVTLSYLIAGLAKLKQADWRNGVALASFVNQSAYGAPSWARALVRSPNVARFAALAVIGFEVLSPLAWFDPRLCVCLLVVGLGFHVANALVFGLNRFMFAWAAAYPALFYCSHWLAR
jgi:hypothetical protein